MSNYVWLVEHREWTDHVMDCTIIHVASTLQIAEHLLRNDLGAKSLECWYAIYPEVVDHPSFGDKPYPTEIIKDDGHFVLNFYDENFNQIETQPEDPGYEHEESNSQYDQTLPLEHIPL